MKKKKILFLTQAAMIAAFYVVLTALANTASLASGVIQVRLSEMLTVLPAFTPAAIPGLAIGCFLSNLLTGCCILDIIMGSIATLIGGVGAYLLRKWKWTIPLPAILANALIVPWVLTSPYGYGLTNAWGYLFVTVGIGEIISCGVLGMILYSALEKHAGSLFFR